MGLVGITPSLRSHFEMLLPPDEQPGFREVGVVLNVTPTIEKYNSINLRLNPKVTEFDGFIEYGGQHASIRLVRRCAPPLIIQPSGLLCLYFRFER